MEWWHWAMIAAVYAVVFFLAVYTYGVFGNPRSMTDRDLTYLLFALWPFLLLVAILSIPIAVVAGIVGLLHVLCDVVFALGRKIGGRNG